MALPHGADAEEAALLESTWRAYDAARAELDEHLR